MSIRTVGIQSPIPLIYLDDVVEEPQPRWDSVTYPLDILGSQVAALEAQLGFSHLSP